MKTKLVVGLAAALLLALAWGWYQEWRAHRLAASAAARPFTPVETKASQAWDRDRLPCSPSGEIGLAVARPSPEEVARLAAEYGLVLTRTVTVPGEDRIIEIPVYRDPDTGEEVLPTAERDLPPTPWGGRLFLGVTLPGGLSYARVDPAPEPYREKPAAWRWWLGAGYRIAGPEAHPTEVESGLFGELGVLRDWRRHGRRHTHLVAQGGLGPEGWHLQSGIRLSWEQLPALWRAPRRPTAASGVSP